MSAIQLSDKEEEILEHLWIRIEERGNHPDLSIMPDEELHELVEHGMIVRDGDDVTLTDAGHEEAKMCVRRHRLAERLLSDVLDGGEEAIHAASCKFEHGLHRGLEERVCTILGHPKACPHGRAIPPGDCCRRMESQPGPLLSCLADLGQGERAVIAYLHGDEADDLRKLMALGALPGTQIMLTQRFPSYLVTVGHSQFAIDEKMARQVYVRRSEPVVGSRRLRRRGGRRGANGSE